MRFLNLKKITPLKTVVQHFSMGTQIRLYTFLILMVHKFVKKH